jgi:hypothetical protein
VRAVVRSKVRELAIAPQFFVVTIYKHPINELPIQTACIFTKRVTILKLLFYWYQRLKLR